MGEKRDPEDEPRFADPEVTGVRMYQGNLSLFEYPPHKKLT